MTLPTITDLFDLSGKSALITGGTGALGGAAAKALAGAGATVTLTGGNKAKLDEIVAEITSAGGKAFAYAGRPESVEAVQKMVDAAVKNGGGIDILMIASGSSKPGDSQQCSVDDFDFVQNVNVRQTFMIGKVVGKAMIEQGRGGKVIITSSVRGLVATDNNISYCTSKAATDMLVKCFSAELGGKGITVNAIAPTIFRSPLTSWLYEDKGAAVREKVVSRIPVGRLGEPEDFMGSVVFLGAKASDFISGHIMYVDGGFVTV